MYIYCKTNNKMGVFQIKTFYASEQVLGETYISSNFIVARQPRVSVVNVVIKNDIETHYRCFLAIHNTQTETYRDLLHVNGKTNIPTQKIQLLMSEIYKYLNKISPPFT